MRLANGPIARESCAMRLWLAGAIIASVFTGPASAQIAPELLGGGAPGAPMFGEPFYKGAEGSWVLVRERENTGYHCSVNFITRQGTFSLRGPGSADDARKHYGAIWFVSNLIPETSQPERVQITLSGNNPTATVSAAHVSRPGLGGALLLVVDIEKSMQEKPDSNEIAVQFQGKEVFRSRLVQLQAAYRTLARCMSAAGR